MTRILLIANSTSSIVAALSNSKDKPKKQRWEPTKFWVQVRVQVHKIENYWFGSGSVQVQKGNKNTI